MINGSNIRLAIDANKCLDLTNGNTSDRTNIELWDCQSARAKQSWIYDVKHQVIRSGVDFNKCLDVSSTADGSNLQIYTCNYSPGQKWLIDGIPTSMPTSMNQQIRFSKDTDKCVDIHAASTTNGTNIQLYHCHTSNNSQFFIFDSNRLRMQAAPEKCVGPDPSSSLDAINVQLWDCTTNNLQQWIYDGFAKSFRSEINTNACMDVSDGNTANSTNIQLKPCDGSDAQRFEIGN